MTRRPWHRFDKATAELQPPLAVVDLDAFRANAADLVRRAGGKPIRVASKSVRIRRLIEQVLDHDGFRGVMAFAPSEAIWLAKNGTSDILVGYPTVDAAAMAEIGHDERLAAKITLTVDHTAHIDLLEDALGPSHPDIKLCLDVDTSWRPLGAWVGARRSPIRTAEQAIDLVENIQARNGFRIVGVLTYEAQIAGVPDAGPAVKFVKRRSAEDIAQRRARMLSAISELTELEFVNAGGTGSLEISGSDSYVDELTAGSGLIGSTLFDGYHDFRPRPAALFAFPVVRRPAPGVATVFSGGWIASGPHGRSRSPTPCIPAGLRLSGMEGAGEVQTPVLGRAADELEVGDRVWFRHAKAGEPFEHVTTVHLLEGDRIVGSVPTYRGEGKAFGV